MLTKQQFLLILIIVSGFTTNQAVLTSNDQAYYGYEADRYNWSEHPCRRDCNGAAPARCHYVFVVEILSSMSKACYDCPFNLADCYRPHCMPADGFQKTLHVVNRRLPGPTIEVCQDDTIIVEVKNVMLSETVTIHWHGVNQQGTPFMDGVPYITQCPILPGSEFTYVFNASTHGTYFWHSHIGNQRADGLYGALIIHPTPKDYVHRHLYDYDNQHIIINDWTPLTGDGNMIKEWHDRLGVNPNTLLVNGLGRNRLFEQDNQTAYSPTAIFDVKPNKRYRFRLTSAGTRDCPIEMAIDNHSMLVISLDAEDIEPVEVDIITIWPGERVDFIVFANQLFGNFWMRFRGLANCRNNSTSGANQVAILRYTNTFVPFGTEVDDPPGNIGYSLLRHTRSTRVLNPFNRGTESDSLTNVNIPSLTSVLPNDESLNEKVDYQAFITFDFYHLNNYDYHRANLYGYHEVPQGRRMGTFQLNHITFKHPPFPLQTQWNMIKPDTLCNTTTLSRNCLYEQCTCTQVMFFELNSVVEFIFVDEGVNAIINHPLHLHGYFFRVVATENLDGPVSVDRIKKLDAAGLINRRLDRAPLKDTIRAPGGGYTIIRFYANNPGFWYFHCHFDEHDNAGMSFVVQVGQYKDFPPTPKNFPTCRNFEPMEI